jgi:hypothetical protein
MLMAIVGLMLDGADELSAVDSHIQPAADFGRLTQQFAQSFVSRLKPRAAADRLILHGRSRESKLLGRAIDQQVNYEFGTRHCDWLGGLSVEEKDAHDATGILMD